MLDLVATVITTIMVLNIDDSDTFTRTAVRYEDMHGFR